jgi:hypothetical protein
VDAAESTYDTVWTRSATYLPAAMTKEEFLEGRLTPRGALIKVDGICVAEASHDDLCLLINLLRVACMEDGKVAIQ